MKPVRRNIRKHYGLTAKQVAVRSKRPWYFQSLVTVLLIALGYGIAYWQLSYGKETFTQLVKTNQAIQTQLIQLQRQLQTERVAQEMLKKDLNHIQEENMHVKEELLFYKNMTTSKKK